jgi:prevent-host-death family protein
MVTTLRNAKAKLSAFVALAQHGEEVVISVRGRPAVRLVAAQPVARPDRQQWLAELAAIRARWSLAPQSATTDRIIGELREERC